MRWTTNLDAQPDQSHVLLEMRQQPLSVSLGQHRAAVQTSPRSRSLPSMPAASSSTTTKTTRARGIPWILGASDEGDQVQPSQGASRDDIPGHRSWWLGQRPCGLLPPTLHQEVSKIMRRNHTYLVSGRGNKVTGKCNVATRPYINKRIIAARNSNDRWNIVDCQNTASQDYNFGISMDYLALPAPQAPHVPPAPAAPSKTTIQALHGPPKSATPDQELRCRLQV